MKTRMIRSLRVILGILALAAVGCTAREGTGVSVDGFLAVEHPDSARSRNDRARWSLILGLAEVSSGDTLAGKKFLDRGMRYYERHGSGSERAAAWYTYAQAHVKAGNLEEGIRGYTQAAILAEEALTARSSDDSLRRGTETLLVAVYHTLGLLYFEQGYNAVEPFAKAVEAARANGNTEQEGYSRFMLASSYCANGDYEQAVKTLEPLVAAADPPAKPRVPRLPRGLDTRTAVGRTRQHRSRRDPQGPAVIRNGRIGRYRTLFLQRRLGNHLPAGQTARFGTLLHRTVARLPGYVPSGRCRAVRPGCRNLPRPGRRLPGLRLHEARCSAGRRSPNSNDATARPTRWRCARRRCDTGRGLRRWQPCWS